MIACAVPRSLGAHPRDELFAPQLHVIAQPVWHIAHKLNQSPRHIQLCRAG